MARVNGPLFSITASGKLADAIVYSRWKGRDYVRQWLIPQNPRDPKQVNVRLAFALLVAYWHTQTDPNKALWQTFADDLKLSGFNVFMGRGMLAYMIQLGSGKTAESVTVVDTPPDDVWTWVEAT